VKRLHVVEAGRFTAFSILQDLPAAELEELSGVMTERDVEPETEVVTLDDYGTAIYFIEEGDAEVRSGDGGPSRTLAPGDMFGEIGLLLTGERTATVVARTPMRLLSLAGQDFDRIRDRVPELERRLRALGVERAAR
jgi:CRP-like cAMP-binding protein